MPKSLVSQITSTMNNYYHPQRIHSLASDHDYHSALFLAIVLSFPLILLQTIAPTFVPSNKLISLVHDLSDSFHHDTPRLTS